MGVVSGFLRVLVGVTYIDRAVSSTEGLVVFVGGKGAARILSDAAKTFLRALIRSSVFGSFLLPTPRDWMGVCFLENAATVLVLTLRALFVDCVTGGDAPFKRREERVAAIVPRLCLEFQAN